ncbi:MAG: transposase [Cyclobacteriaceae bacterium]
MEILTEHAQFLTASIYKKKHLLSNESYKTLIVNSLRFLVNDGRVFVNAFVIMNNHIHLIWQAREGYQTREIQRDFLKYIAQMIKFDLQKNDPKLLSEFFVNLKDREYQIWQRSPMNIELYTEKVFEQKLDYIHYNPVKAGLCQLPEEYKYSSASFYYLQKSEFEFLTHYKD